MEKAKGKSGRRYDAASIQILQNIDHVRARPGMYIGGISKEGLHHVVWEILDNSIDEVINGHASKIEVILEADFRGITIRDNGRGIPTGIHPELGIPTITAVFTHLGMGGKFDGDCYRHSGGLHGVGAAVANALSERLEVRVRRGGKSHEVYFVRGVPQGEKKTSAMREPGTGTEVYLRPDPDIFGARTKFDPDILRERIEAKSFLHKGLTITYTDKSSGKTETFHHAAGLSEYLDGIVSSQGKTAVHKEKFYVENSFPKLELAIVWTESSKTLIYSYVNGVPTTDGGTHENGLRAALGKALRAYMKHYKLGPKGVSVGLDDILEGLIAVYSIYVTDPQFQSQTKNRLNNPEVAGQVEAAIRPAIEQWLHENRSIGNSIASRIILAAKARAASRSAVTEIKRKSAGQSRIGLPGKLADCSSNDPSKCELFIVEGDSAGGSAKMGRDRSTQAILPLRGKVLNAAQASMAKIMNNEELRNIIKALGCGIGKDFNRDRLRYDRIILLMDADSDGHHIATLLLTFFYKYMPDLIHHGHVYIAQPPLFRVNVGKKTYWASDDEHLHRILSGIKGRSEIQRFKGLGEMMPATLRDTTLDPKKRQLIRIGILDDLESDRAIHDLMGKDSATRYTFIMERAAEADRVDF